MLKVYISYGTVQDQVTALRLQALAAVNGLSAYVPPARVLIVFNPCPRNGCG